MTHSFKELAQIVFDLFVNDSMHSPKDLAQRVDSILNHHQQLVSKLLDSPIKASSKSRFICEDSLHSPKELARTVDSFVSNFLHLPEELA